MPRRPEGPWYWAARDGWYVTIDKKRIPLAKGKEARAEATREFHRVMLAGGRADAKAAPATVADLCDLFLEAAHGRLRAGTLKASTVAFYDRHLQSFCAHSGKLAAAGLKPLHVHAWLDAHTWGRTTRNGAIAAVKAAFRWAHRQGLLESHPLEFLAKPGGDRREAILSPEQFATILAGTKDEAFRDLLRILWLTGARPGEVAAVTAAEVRLDQSAWVIAPKKSKTGGRTGRPRVVYLNAEARAITERAMAAHPEGPIFRNARGTPWRRGTMSARFWRIRAKYGFGYEATAYAIRHRWITDALEAGVPIATVAELAGHTSTQMVARIYNHLHENRGHLSEALDRIRPGDVTPS